MTELYLDIFVMICFGLIAWGIIKVERIYQYPFFMGAIFLAFIAPQASALVNNPGLASSAAIERVLLMSCLCVASCAVGYALPVNTKWLIKWQIDVDERRLSRAAFFLMAMGYLFWFLLLRQDRIGIETKNHVWTGPATIYVFFTRVIYIAFAIFIFQSLKRPKLTNILYTAISGYLPLLIALIGRRQGTLNFLIIVGFPIFAVHRLKPSRWMIILGIIALIFIIPLMGAIRWRFWDMIFAGQWQELLDIAQNEFTDLPIEDL